MKKIKKFHHIKSPVKILFICLIIFCYVISLVMLILYLNNKKTDRRIPIYSYQIDQDLQYHVNLYDNSFIENSKQSSNEMYLSELIKTIEIEFKHVYSSSKSIELNYQYKVLATINGMIQVNEEKKSVWNKTSSLKELTTENIDSSNFIIQETLLIDFPTYKNEVEAFKKKFGMSLTTTLDVALFVQVEGEIEQEKINQESVMMIKIPLGVQAFSIEEEYENKIQQQIYAKLEVQSSKFIRIGSIVFFFILGVIGSIVFFYQVVERNVKSKYEKKLKKILKNYGEIIIEIASPINQQNYEIIEVKSMEEMIDLEGELRIPINFYERKKGELGEFTLLHHQILYRYTIKDK